MVSSFSPGCMTLPLIRRRDIADQRIFEWILRRDSMLLSYKLFYSLSDAPVTGQSRCRKIKSEMKLKINSMINFEGRSNLTVHNRKPPKYVRYPRRTNLPPDLGTFMGTTEIGDQSQNESVHGEGSHPIEAGPMIDDWNDTVVKENEEDKVWDADEVEAISSLFQGRIPQKPGKLNRERPLPLPLPCKLRPSALPAAKRNVRTTSLPAVSSRSMLSNQIYKDPTFLVNLAREIRGLSTDENVSIVLNKCGRFLRRGSLSLTIRELGHMDLPERALQTFCWAEKQPHLFPDDKILASTVEVLARTHKLRFLSNLEKYASFAGKTVLEAMARGFIRGGNLNLAWRLLVTARNDKRMLDPSIYTKLLLELGKSPDKHDLVLALLEELGGRDDLDLNQQDCTAIMKVCVRIGKFELVEGLFNWYKESGRVPSVVMYTTVIHSRYSEKRYREALALVWEMEGANCLFDLPAYRVVIKLFVAVNDLSRTVRYFSKLKEAGFSPTYDLYRDLINAYLVSGRYAKCKEVCRELESAGFNMDAQLKSQLELERNIS
ncbi:hypothetical protein Ancab_007040 [Ancistrocladus abbreviatus]